MMKWLNLARYAAVRALIFPLVYLATGAGFGWAYYGARWSFYSTKEIRS